MIRKIVIGYGHAALAPIKRGGYRSMESGAQGRVPDPGCATLGSSTHDDDEVERKMAPSGFQRWCRQHPGRAGCRYKMHVGHFDVRAPVCGSDAGPFYGRGLQPARDPRLGHCSVVLTFPNRFDLSRHELVATYVIHGQHSL